MAAKKLAGARRKAPARLAPVEALPNDLELVAGPDRAPVPLSRRRKSKTEPPAIAIDEPDEEGTLDAPDDGENSSDKSSDDQAFLSLMRDRWEAAYAKEEANILAAYEDLQFRAGGVDQWDPLALAARMEEERPIITVNLIPQFVRQVTGDIRQSRPAIKVVPVDSRGDKATADIIGGMFRYIENRSVAKSAYFKGADSQVAAGVGHWRVATEYADNSTFNQEIRIVPVSDQVSVLWDPDALEQTKADGEFAFEPVDLSKLAFKAKHPNARSDNPSSPGTDEHRMFSEWYGEDYVRVAAYWFREPIKRRLALMPDGSVDDLTDKGDEDVAAASLAGARVELRDSTRVMRAVVSADEILEAPKPWPGRYIPLIRVVGEEIEIGRRVVRHGIIRHAKDPQRLVNYYESQQAEILALQPKAPFIASWKSIENHLAAWNEANSGSAPFLPYDPDPANGGAAPERAQPPVASSGIMEALANSHANMKGVIGIYDPGLGAQSNETSGKAILARQREGDTGTYVYVENFSQAVAHTAVVVLDLIPHVYDTQRAIRIAGDDGKTDTVEINKPGEIQNPGSDPVTKLFNDVTVGAYDVVMSMGPSFATRRQEALDGMTNLIQAAPDLAPIVLDLIARDSDWPSADEIAERIEATLPPAVQALLAKKRGEPPAPDPAADAQAAQLAAEQQNATAAAELDKLKIQLERMRLEAEREKLEVEKLRIQADRDKVVLSTAVAGATPPAGTAPTAPAAPAGDEQRISALEQAVRDVAAVVEGIRSAIEGPVDHPAADPALAA